MSLSRLLLVPIAVMGFAGAAQAAYIPTTWDSYVSGGKTISAGESLPYTHDLTAEGFTVGTDLVTDFRLTIDLFDDATDRWLEFEKAFVDVPGVFGDRFVFSFGNNAYDEENWSIAGLLELNLSGTLSVIITSIYGDFVFGGSELVAKGVTQDRTSVPEPATLGLLGMGLLGIGLGRRRKSART